MENKQDKGFTLVELLIVIVILGILATVTVFAVRGITDQGQTSACNADKKTIQTAVEAYYAQNGTAHDPATEAGSGHGRSSWSSPSKNYDVVAGGRGSATDPARPATDCAANVESSPTVMLTT